MADSNKYKSLTRLNSLSRRHSFRGIKKDDLFKQINSIQFSLTVILVQLILISYQ